MTGDENFLLKDNVLALTVCWALNIIFPQILQNLIFKKLIFLLASNKNTGIIFRKMWTSSLRLILNICWKNSVYNLSFVLCFSLEKSRPYSQGYSNHIYPDLTYIEFMLLPGFLVRFSHVDAGLWAFFRFWKRYFGLSHLSTLSFRLENRHLYLVWFSSIVTAT